MKDQITNFIYNSFVMGIEKQIRIDLKEGENLTNEDIENISIINNFLYKQLSTENDENEDTIIDSDDEEIRIIRKNLKTKFQNRIMFINSNPNPEDYLVFSEQNASADKQREELTTKKGAEKRNIDYLKYLIEDIEYYLTPEYIPNAIKHLELILQNFDQSKTQEYNSEILEIFSIKDFFITNEDIEKYTLSYEKYDKDQERLIEQLKSPKYKERLMKEFNCSEEVAQKHQNTRIANCCIGYNLDDNKDSIDAHFSPCKDDASQATILPPNRENTGNRYVLFHEIGGHRVTNAEGINGESFGGLSDYAKRELLTSFDVRRNDGKIHLSGFSDLSYYGNLSERYARKKVLDFEMEDLGIKNYEDPFTESTFKELMEVYNTTVISIEKGEYNELTAKGNKLLSKNAIEFIETTKKDFQTYEKIFNNIA